MFKNDEVNVNTSMDNIENKASSNIAAIGRCVYDSLEVLQNKILADLTEQQKMDKDTAQVITNQFNNSKSWFADNIFRALK